MSLVKEDTVEVTMETKIEGVSYALKVVFTSEEFIDISEFKLKALRQTMENTIINKR